MALVEWGLWGTYSCTRLPHTRLLHQHLLRPRSLTLSCTKVACSHFQQAEIEAEAEVQVREEVQEQEQEQELPFIPFRSSLNVHASSAHARKNSKVLNVQKAAHFDDVPRDEDDRCMREALREAQKAAASGEVPVGAVLVSQGKIVARAHNRVEKDKDPTAHAEMICIRSTARHLGGWRLLNSTLYVTLEPCPMCAGALLQARVGAVVWGARNPLLGADGSWVRKKWIIEE